MSPSPHLTSPAQQPGGHRVHIVHDGVDYWGFGATADIAKAAAHTSIAELASDQVVERANQDSFARNYWKVK